MQKPLDNIFSRHNSSCYFRSLIQPPFRKALLQITERCNLFCAHCFVSAGNYGDTIQTKTINDKVIPLMKLFGVTSVTLTGGEPFTHPDIIEIVHLLRNAGIRVGICTNATLISLDQMNALVKVGNVHVNVSLDGFHPESHGKFRGDKDSFFKTIETSKLLSQHNLLQGFLVTPNNLASIEEYEELCDFAVKNKATYVLMNPLSRMGRGTQSIKTHGVSNDIMENIKKVTSKFSERIELVYVRFPNNKRLLASCQAGNIIYIFANGEVTVCPYLVFAARTSGSKHKPEEFVVGNINNRNIIERLNNYKFRERYHLGNNPFCRSCHLESTCGKGCPAAIITSGHLIEEIDLDMCPTVDAKVFSDVKI